MGNSLEKQIIIDWLNSAKRQVRQTDKKASAFISCNFNAPLDEIWDAWTDPSKLSLWFAKVIGEIKEGNEIAFDVGAPFNITSKILKLTPKNLLHFTWFYPGRVVDEIEVRFSQNGSSTTIELEQYSNDKSNWWHGAGSGWESALVRLSLLLSGKDPKSISNDTFDEVFGPLWLTASSSK